MGNFDQAELIFVIALVCNDKGNLGKTYTNKESMNDNYSFLSCDKVVKKRQPLVFSNKKQRYVLSYFLLMTLMLFYPKPVHSQTHKYIKIAGIISDSINSLPLSYVDIFFINSKTDSTVMRITSDLDGKYNIALQSIKDIKAVYRYIGYKHKEILLSDEFVQTEHSIRLSLDVQALDEVTVLGRIPKYKSHNDGYVVSVENTLLSASTNTMEVLSKIPKVQVSNNNISVLGAGKAAIYLNGVLLHSTATLESMLASEIKEIKVIDTPGANYPSSTPAVIEITTTKQSVIGWGVGMQTITAKGDGWRQTYAPSFNIAGKSLSASVSYNFKTADYLYDESNIRIYDNNEINNDILTKSKLKNSNYWKATINFHPNKQHFIGIQSIGDVNHKIEDVSNVTYFHTNTDNGAMSKQHGNINRTSFINNITYKYSAPSEKMNITLVYDNSYFTYTKDFIINENMIDLSNFNDIQNNINSLKANVEFRLPHKWSVNTGAQGIGASNNSSSELNNDAVFEKTNDLNMAAFISAEKKSDKLSYGISARYEYNKQTQLSSKYNNTTSNIFPSAHISYGFNDYWGVKAIYTNQIYRPSYQDLDPSIVYIDQYAYFQGNPALIPTIHHKVKLELNYRKFATLGVSYIKKRNEFAWIVMQDSEKHNVSKATQVNIDKTNTLSLDAVIPYENNWFSGYIAGGLIYNKSLYSEQNIININNTMYYLQSSLNFSLPRKFEIGTDLKYTSKGLENIFFFDPIFRCDISLKKSFFDNKLSIVLAWKDIFKSDKMYTYTQYSNNFIGYNYYSDKSIIQLSISFRFIKNKIKKLDLNNAISPYIDRIKNY